MSNFPPYSSDIPTSDRQTQALREARRSEDKNILKTRARIEEIEARLRERREMEYLN